MQIKFWSKTFGALYLKGGIFFLLYPIFGRRWAERDCIFNITKDTEPMITKISNLAWLSWPIRTDATKLDTAYFSAAVAWKTSRVKYGYTRLS